MDDGNDAWHPTAAKHGFVLSGIQAKYIHASFL